ncbi:MAG: cobyric acid synthase [Vibrio sp.]
MKFSPSSLMIQGTTSDAGKTTLVAGLCRLLKRRGYDVAPFKPQNMALNSAVTPCGGEVSRATAMQAWAGGIAPHPDMNPVLIKPNSDMQAQIIIQGQAQVNLGQISSKSYYQLTMPKVLQSFERLCQKHQTVIVEGAGSPAEINLRTYDIANMGFAENADVDVVIVADIDKGGVFAHLYGTLALLSKSEQSRVKGFIINRFRGDLALLQSGLDWLEQTTGKPVLGVLPYLHNLNLEAEDSLDSRNLVDGNAKIKITVPVLPRMSNHTDFDALRLHPEIDFRFCYQWDTLAGSDIIILPGSKSVHSDLAFLREQGWEQEIATHLRYQGKLIGICGGFQMLGETLEDPYGVEGQSKSIQGLGYLPLKTQLAQQKTLSQVQTHLNLNQDSPVMVKGYEIHSGITQLTLTDEYLTSANLFDYLSSDNQVYGTYLHGIFDTKDAISHICQWAGVEVARFDKHAVQEESINRLADMLEAHLDITTLFNLLGLDDDKQDKPISN